MLALHQPVAVDLRRIISVLKINADLERMADLCVNIAERVVTPQARCRRCCSQKRLVRKMTDLTTMMVRQSLDAFMRLDGNLARRVIQLDDDVDRCNKEIIDEPDRPLRKPRRSSSNKGLSLFSGAVRHLERIADHATNIAEDVVYLIYGRSGHRPPEAVAG